LAGERSGDVYEAGRDRATDSASRTNSGPQPTTHLGTNLTTSSRSNLPSADGMLVTEQPPSLGSLPHDLNHNHEGKGEGIQPDETLHLRAYK